MQDDNPYAPPETINDADLVPSEEDFAPPTPVYAFSARTRSSRIVSDWVQANDGDEAVAALTEHGFTEIVLHMNDVGAHYTALTFTGGEKAEDVIALRTRRTYASILWYFVARNYRGGWYIFPALAILLILIFVNGPEFSVMHLALLGVLALPLVGAIFIASGQRRSPRFEAIAEADSWGRWEEMLERIEACRDQTLTELARYYEAQALAGLGRVDEALDLLEPVPNDFQVPMWLYWVRVAEICSRGDRWDEAAEAYENAAKLAPRCPIVWNEYGLVLLRLGRPDRAAEAVTEAGRHAMSDTFEPIVRMAEGRIALERGDYPAARGLLLEAVRKLTPFLDCSPMMHVALANAHAYLCEVEAALGDHASAQRYYDLAEPRLIALKRDFLIDRCRKALGDAG